jgi:hypothetical protein
VAEKEKLVAPKMILSKPPKPPNQMTDAEIHDWAKKIYDGLVAQRPAVEAIKTSSASKS